MLNFRVIGHVLGILLCGLSAILLIPLIFDVFDEGQHWSSFTITSLSSCIIGVGLMLSNKGEKNSKIDTREAFLLTVLSWMMCCFFSALPFWLIDHDCSMLDAIFESTSAFTTTGQTIFKEIHDIPDSLILWRTLIQWFGGIGIVVLAMTVFPALKIGGIQLLRSEFSDKVEKILPRVSQIGAALLFVYALLTGGIFFSLLVSDMSVFTAFCYATAAISTGGMVNTELSVHTPYISYVLMIGMILGASTLSLYVRVWQKKSLNFWRDDQFRSYLRFVGSVCVCVSAYFFIEQFYTFENSIQEGCFTAISFCTTTGFTLVDHALMGPFLSLILMCAMMIGGCSGSTAGGYKVYRVQILLRVIVSHFRQIRRPRGVFVPYFNGQKITQGMALNALIIGAIYTTSIFIVSSLLALCGIDFTSSVSGAVATLTNTGTAFGNMLGAHAVTDLPSSVKCVLMAAMILGRLEFIAVLVLFMPSFWKS